MSSGIWRTPFLEETVAYADLSTRWLLAKLATNFFLFFLFPGVYVPGTFRTRKLNETGRHQACDWMLVAFRQETHLNAGEEKKTVATLDGCVLLSGASVGQLFRPHLTRKGSERCRRRDITAGREWNDGEVSRCQLRDKVCRRITWRRPKNSQAASVFAVRAGTHWNWRGCC